MEFVRASCDILTHSDQTTGATHNKPRRNLSGMCRASASDSHSLYLFFSVCRESGGRKLLTELQADSRAECGGVSRQGKPRQEEEAQLHVNISQLYNITA